VITDFPWKKYDGGGNWVIFALLTQYLGNAKSYVRRTSVEPASHNEKVGTDFIIAAYTH
jgi:hypothetical protein